MGFQRYIRGLLSELNIEEVGTTYTTPVFDVVIIGGGVLGTATAARLSSTSARVCLLETESDVGEHASKGNAGVAVSYYDPADRLQTRLINASNPGWEALCGRLDVPYRRLGALMVALTNEEAARLELTRQEAESCGVAVEMLTSRQVQEIEPLVTQNCIAGLSLPDEGIIDPMRLTVAYARLAAINGVEIRLGEQVKAIRSEDDGTSIITTSRSHIRGRFLVNAAGVAAGLISKMAGGEDLGGWPRKGQYLVLDRAFGRNLSKIVFCTHLPDTKGINVVPTTHGSALLGPTAANLNDSEDRSTDSETLAHILEQATRLVPAVASANVIKSFAANRPAGNEPNRLRIDSRIPNLLHLTDRSAGVSISPAAAEEVLMLLLKLGLDVTEREDATESLPMIPRLRTSLEPETLVSLDPSYGQVVCVCEQVSAAEIERAFDGPIPANSIDGVRKRTGASYGRCQGSLCLAGISFMTAMHTGTSPATVQQTTRGTVGS